MSPGLHVRASAAGRMTPVSRRAAADPPPAPVQTAPVSTPQILVQPSYADLQRLVDQAANFHVGTVPAGSRSVAGGMEIKQPVHLMSIEQFYPAGGGMQAATAAGPAAGNLEAALRWIPDGFVARPDRHAPETPFRPGVAQRFVIQDGTLQLGPHAGFRFFGAGRVFPVCAGGSTRYMAGVICNIVEGFGGMHGLEGNCTWCGDFTHQGGFRGHIMIRVRDPHGRLITNDPVPTFQPTPDPEPGVSYLSWIGQKTPDARLANSASMGADEKVRGLNIPVDLKIVSTGWSVAGGHLHVRALHPAEVIGLEIGFGKEAAPRSPLTGTAMAPYQFEGVSRYTFHDRQGNPVGAFTANVLEGRSMNVHIEGAPGQPALRFGFFGPLITGTGCFAGVQGMLYGASGSVFNPPPLDHVISNWYVLRLYDPEGRFRSTGRRMS